MHNSSLTPTLTALQHLQVEFAIIDLSGEIRVIQNAQIKGIMDGSIRGLPAFYKKVDANLVMRRFLETLPIASDSAAVIKSFWHSPETKLYRSTSFSPKTTKDTSVNFWVGPITSSERGSWVKIRDYLLNVICDGDYITYEYLIRYIAHMVQRPEEKPGVMIVMLGGQGTGKGMFFTLLRAIWPMTTLQVSKIDQVVGRFTSSLERNYILCMDEALFAGNRQAIDNLKSIVTEQYLHIEEKQQPCRTIESFHRIFASSNHEHFAHVEPDDRRFVFLQLSTSRKQDLVYFAEIANLISDSKTMSALLYYLLKKDLTHFNVRLKPKTNEQFTQKIKSLDGFYRFWFELLNDSEEHLRRFSLKWNQSIFISTKSIMNAYREYNKGAEKYQPIQATYITGAVKRVCPNAITNVREMVTSAYGQTQMRGIRLPSLDIARRDFSVYLGHDIAWENADDADDAEDARDKV